MRTKNFSKKLVLNRATVANLTNDQMRALKGGATETSYDVINHCYTLCVPGYCSPIGVISKDCQMTTN
ncbi:MAG TPA: class I lanthipeptide [Candidatus Kapabacteria bacterium]|nr:class I lanthipeptide [Candidatus Kapabacteria bacterium]